MPTLAEAFRIAGAGGRLGQRPTVPQDEDAVLEAVAPNRSRGMFERVMRALDMPGAAVRNILTGHVVSAGKNLLELTTGGLYDSGDEYAPDFGFVGNLLSDPLLYLTGGAAAAKTAGKAAVGLGGRLLQRGVSRGLLRGLTRAGTKAVAEEAGSLLARRMARVGAAAAVRGADEAALGVFRLGKQLGPKAAEAGFKTVEEAAVSRIARKAAEKGVKLGAEDLGRVERAFAGPKTTAAELARFKPGLSKGPVGAGALWTRQGAPPTIQQLTREVISGRVVAKAAGVESLSQATDDAIRQALKDPRKLEAAAKETLGVTKQATEMGGLRFNIPFVTQPKTIAMAGHNLNIAQVSPLYWLARGAWGAAKQTPAGLRLASWLRGKVGRIYMLPFATQTGKEIAHDFLSGVKVKAQEADEWIKRTFRGYDEPMLKDFGQSIYGIDVHQTGVIDRTTWVAKHGDAKLYDRAMHAWRSKADELLAEERKYGVLLGQVPERIQQRRMAKLNPIEAARVQGWNLRAAEQVKRARAALGGSYAQAPEDVIREAVRIHRTGKAERERVLEEIKGLYESAGMAPPSDLFATMPWEHAEKAVRELGDEGYEYLSNGPKLIKGWDEVEARLTPLLKGTGYKDLGEVLSDIAKSEGRFSNLPAEATPLVNRQELAQMFYRLPGVPRQQADAVLELIDLHAASVGMSPDEVARRYFAGVTQGGDLGRYALRQTADRRPWYYSKLVKAVRGLDVGEKAEIAPKPIDLSKVPPELREKLAARPPKPGKTIFPVKEALTIEKGREAETLKKLNALLIREGVKQTEIDYVLRDFVSWARSASEKAGGRLELSKESLLRYVQANTIEINRHSWGDMIPAEIIHWDRILDVDEFNPWAIRTKFRRATHEDIRENVGALPDDMRTADRIYVVEDPRNPRRKAYIYRRPITKNIQRGVRFKELDAKMVRRGRTMEGHPNFGVASEKKIARELHEERALRSYAGLHRSIGAQGWRTTYRDSLGRWITIDHPGLPDGGLKQLRQAAAVAMGEIRGRVFQGNPAKWREVRDTYKAVRFWEPRRDPYDKVRGMAAWIMEDEAGRFYTLTKAYNRTGGSFATLEDAQEAIREAYSRATEYERRAGATGGGSWWWHSAPGPKRAHNMDLLTWKRPEHVELERAEANAQEVRAALSRKYGIVQPSALLPVSVHDTDRRFIDQLQISLASPEDIELAEKAIERHADASVAAATAGETPRTSSHWSSYKDAFVHVQTMQRPAVRGDRSYSARYVAEIQGDDYQAVTRGDAIWASEVEKKRKVYERAEAAAKDSLDEWRNFKTWLESRDLPVSTEAYNRFWAGRFSAGDLAEQAQRQPTAEELEPWRTMRGQLEAARGIDIGEPPDLYQPLIERYARHADWLDSEARAKSLRARWLKDEMAQHVPDKVLPTTSEMRRLAIKHAFDRAVENGEDGVMFATGDEQFRAWGSPRYVFWPTVAGEEELFLWLRHRFGEKWRPTPETGLPSDIFRQFRERMPPETHGLIEPLELWVEQNPDFVTEDFFEWYLDHAPKITDPHTGDRLWSFTLHDTPASWYSDPEMKRAHWMQARYQGKIRGLSDITSSVNERWAEKLWNRIERSTGRGEYSPRLDGMRLEYDEKLMGDLVDYLREMNWLPEISPKGRDLARAWDDVRILESEAAQRGKSTKDTLEELKREFVDDLRSEIELEPETRYHEKVIDWRREPVPSEILEDARDTVPLPDHDDAVQAAMPSAISHVEENLNDFPSVVEDGERRWRENEEEYVYNEYLPERYAEDGAEASDNLERLWELWADDLTREAAGITAPDRAQHWLPGLEGEREAIEGDAKTRSAEIAKLKGELEDQMSGLGLDDFLNEDLVKEAFRSAGDDPVWGNDYDLIDYLMDDNTLDRDKFIEEFSSEAFKVRADDDLRFHMENEEVPSADELHSMGLIRDDEIRDAAEQFIHDNPEEFEAFFDAEPYEYEGYKESYDLLRAVAYDIEHGNADPEAWQDALDDVATILGDAETSARPVTWTRRERLFHNLGTRPGVNLEGIRMHPGVHPTPEEATDLSQMVLRLRDAPYKVPRRRGGYPFVPFSDKMRSEIAEHGQPLLQRGKGVTKGATTFLEDGRAVVQAFETGDISTIVHELGHVFIPALPDQELGVLAGWAGVKPELLRKRAGSELAGLGGKELREWRRGHEKLARAWERYLRAGKAPQGATPAVMGLFAKFREWLLSIYRRISGPRTPQHVRDVFDKMLTPNALAGRARLPELTEGANARRLTLQQRAEMDVARQRLSSLPQEVVDTIRRGPPPESAQRGTYLPQQYTDELIDQMQLTNMGAALDNQPDVFPTRQVNEPQGGISTTHHFAEERTYDEAKDFVKHVEEAISKVPPEVRQKGVPGVEMNAAVLIRRRLESHARAIEAIRLKRKANLAFGGHQGYELAATPGERGLAQKEVELRDRAFGDWIKQGGVKLRKREGLWEMLAWWNRHIFKKWVTIGFGPVPHPAFHTRNIISGLWMAAADPRIGLDPVHGIKHVTDALFGAMSEIPGLKGLPKSQLRRVLRGEAVAGQMVKGLEHLGIDEETLYAAARQLGVIRQNFVREEELLGELYRSFPEGAKGTPKRAWELIKQRLIGSELPGRITEAIEDGMRLNGFVKALKRDLDFRQAAQAVRDAFVDYAIVSDAHRTLRDLVPFAQFTIGMIPQTAKMIGQNPRVLAPLKAFSSSQRLGNEADPRLVPPWVREQANVPTNTTDEEGNPQYLVGAATPFEAPINLPWAGSFARTGQRLVSQMHPLVKGALEATFNTDTFFGGQLGTYRRDTPVSKMLPDFLVGREGRTITNRAGQKEQITEVSPTFHRALGFTPFSRASSTINQLLDERKSVVARIISATTGVKVVSVDKARELRRLVADYLEDAAARGDIGVFQRFFARGEVDPQLAAVLRAHSEKKR